MTTLPTLMALRCFDASARHESFTKASEEVHLTQGAVSHQIIGLEGLMGVRLFVRKRSGLQLTAAGRSYWGEISVALRQIERATQEIVTNKGRGGTLNLSVASSFASYWLIPRLADFVAAHPEVTLNLSTRIGPVDFTNSEHDAAIEYCSGATADLRAEPVLPLELRPYASPQMLKSQLRGHRSLRKAALVEVLSTRPLIRHTTVPLAWPSWLSTAGVLDEIPKHQLTSAPQYDLLSMALNGAIAGLGVALLPDFIVGAALASKQLGQLSDTVWTSEKAYYLRYPTWKAELASLRSFTQWLKIAAAETAPARQP